MEFTKEEISAIEKSMNFVTANWHKHLINAVIQLAKNKGVKNLYWNTTDTLDSGNTQEAKVDFFYERLPQQMGFKSTTANLRGKGEERMWHLPLTKEAFSQEGTIPLDRVPKSYQGAVIGITKHRGPYTKDELKKVYQIVKAKKDKLSSQKQSKGFYYSTEQQWTGAQRFTNVDEMVIAQRLTSDVLNDAISHGSDAVKKFLSFRGIYLLTKQL